MTLFRQRSERLELMDDFTLSTDALQQTLDDLTRVNRWLGGKNVLLNAIKKIYRRHHSHFKQTLSIVDIGCGSGDLLRAVKSHLRRYACQAQLTGIDANLFTLNYARRKSQAYPDIQYQSADIFSNQFAAQRFDIITLNTVCHHFKDAELTALLQQLSTQANVAIIINDLHRHWLAYYLIRWLTHLLPCSYLIKHDAPLSVLRAFRKHELVQLLAAIPKASAHIRWRWAFRWQVIIWCK